MSGGHQRIPKGFAQKVGAAEPKPGFTLGQGVAGAPRRMARRRQKPPAEKAQASTMEKRESMQDVLISKDAMTS